MSYRIPNRENLNTQEYYTSFYKQPVEVGPYATNFWKRADFYAYVLRLLKKDRATLLDLGCGSGHGLHYLEECKPGYDLSGADFSSEAIKRTKDCCRNALCSVVDIDRDPLPGDFDYITLIEVLEHLEDPYRAIGKCLASCGVLIVTVPLGHKGDSEPTHIQTGFCMEDFRPYNPIYWSLIRNNVNILVALPGRYYKPELVI